MELPAIRVTGNLFTSRGGIHQICTRSFCSIFVLMNYSESIKTKIEQNVLVHI